MKELQRQASPNIVIALAGNKADLANKRMVEYEVIYSYFKHINDGVHVVFVSRSGAGSEILSMIG